jgi:hypothetical protein
LSSCHTLSYNYSREVNECHVCGFTTGGYKITGGYHECPQCKQLELQQRQTELLERQAEAMERSHAPRDEDEGGGLLSGLFGRKKYRRLADDPEFRSRYLPDPDDRPSYPPPPAPVAAPQVQHVVVRDTSAEEALRQQLARAQENLRLDSESRMRNLRAVVRSNELEEKWGHAPVGRFVYWEPSPELALADVARAKLVWLSMLTQRFVSVGGSQPGAPVHAEETDEEGREEVRIQEKLLDVSMANFCNWIEEELVPAWSRIGENSDPPASDDFVGVNLLAVRTRAIAGELFWASILMVGVDLFPDVQTRIQQVARDLTQTVESNMASYEARHRAA